MSIRVIGDKILVKEAKAAKAEGPGELEKCGLFHRI